MNTFAAMYLRLLGTTGMFGTGAIANEMYPSEATEMSRETTGFGLRGVMSSVIHFFVPGATGGGGGEFFDDPVTDDDGGGGSGGRTEMLSETSFGGGLTFSTEPGLRCTLRERIEGRAKIE